MSKLYGFDPDRIAKFAQELKDGSSLMNEVGFVFVDDADPERPSLECYSERESSASVQLDSWLTLECRRGGARVVFTGEQFFGFPIMVEFAPNAMLSVPPGVACSLTLMPKATILLSLSDSPPDADKSADPHLIFEPVSDLLLQLAAHNALEPIPGLEQKGLRLELTDEAL